MAAKTKRGVKPRTPANTPKKPAGTAKGSAVPPAHLKDEARIAYQRLAGVLKAAGTLDRTDSTLIEMYAVNYALLRKAEGELGGDKLTVKTKRGAVFAHPMIAVMNSTTIRLRGIIADLGLSPASSRYGGDGDNTGEDEDEWGDLLSFTG
jgi:P27 family predicted phage terminase small subunit